MILAVLNNLGENLRSNVMQRDGKVGITDILQTMRRVLTLRIKLDSLSQADWDYGRSEKRTF